MMDWSLSIALTALAITVLSFICIVAIAWTHHPEGLIRAMRTQKGEKKREHEKDC